MKKLDLSLIAELAGVGMIAVGFAMFSIPLALIIVGGLLVWMTERPGQ
jgi:hypothetical protein